MAIVGVAAALFAVALGWFALGPMEPDRADAGDPALVAEGHTIYAQQCAGCHGAELEGEADWRSRRPDGLLPAPPHDASGHTWHHSDAMLFDITRRGAAAVVGGNYRSSMPAFGKVLSDRQIWAALAYIKSRWPADIRAAQERTRQD
jgi:mono/diheme cytochrome c family protein